MPSCEGAGRLREAQKDFAEVVARNDCPDFVALCAAVDCALARIKAAVPGVDAIAAIKAWMRPTADLGGYEPRCAGLRLAGVRG
jgi:hypothetical protein